MNKTIQVVMGLITLILIGLAAASCSKLGSAIEDLAYTQNIIGSWKLVNRYHTIHQNGELTYKDDDNCSTWYYIYEFDSDGTGKRTSTNLNSGDNEVYPITKWQIKGGKIEIWELEDNVSRLEKMDIDEISSSTLIFSGTVEHDGKNGKQKQYIRYTYKRM